MNRAAGLLVGTLASAGLAVGAVAAAPSPAQAAPVESVNRACTTSVFRVSWEVAGVYSAAVRDDAHRLYNKRQGERVTGPTGGTGENWTKVFLGSGGIGFMPKDSVAYVGCA